MVERRSRALEPADEDGASGLELLTELVSAGSADRVYGAPVVVGDRAVITAAEVRTGLGFGYGWAAGVPDGKRGSAPRGRRHREGDEGPRSGAGGGGGVVGRPVAVITVEPDGVHVEPVLDRTKILVTALTAAGALAAMMVRLRRAGRR